MPDRVPRLRRAPLPDDVVALLRGDTGEPNQDRRDALSFRRHLLVGGGSAVAVAVVVDVDGDIVHVQPLPGPASKWRHLLNRAAS